jgi:hypothetical protein
LTAKEGPSGAVKGLAEVRVRVEIGYCLDKYFQKRLSRKFVMTMLIHGCGSGSPKSSPANVVKRSAEKPANKKITSCKYTCPKKKN